MAEERAYDAIVIGGGTNGLTVAGYLAMNGLDVCILEMRHELGGGWASEALPSPGFIANPLSSGRHLYSALPPPKPKEQFSPKTW